KLHGLRQHDHKMLSAVESLGINAGFAAVRHVVADLERSFSGTQGKQERVAVLLFLRYWSRVDGLPTRGHCHALVDLSAVGEIKFEALIAHLGARRIRSVVHREQTNALHLAALRLETHHVGGYADAVNFLGDVVNLHLDRSRSRRSHAVVGHALMDDADEMWARGAIKLQAEIALGIGLGAAGLCHPFAETEKNDIVAGSGLVGGAVRDRAG